MAVIKTNDLTQPLFVVSDDLERAAKDLRARDDSYSRRNYVRVLFAAIELTIYIQKQTILAAAADSSGQLTHPELMMLRGETYDIGSDGELLKRTKRIPMADNSIFTQRCVEKGFGLSLSSHTTGPSWDDFKNAIKLRNRITHPKGHKDFDVSKDEAELALRVGDWFVAFIGDWFGQFIKTAKPVYDIDAASQFPI